MVEINSTVQEPEGFKLKNVDVRVYNRTGSTTAIGDTVMFDISGSDAATTTGSLTGSDSIFANVIQPATNGLDHWFFAICLEAAADNALMKVRVQGIAEANVVGTNATAASERLYPVNSTDTLNSDANTTARALGIATEVTAGASEETITIIFDGLNGVSEPTA